MISIGKNAAFSVGLAAVVAAGGCYRPAERLDTVSPIAGNALAHNKAVQTIDPWPDHAFRRHQVTDGERVRQAYEAYRDGGNPETGAAGGDAAPAGDAGQ